MERQHSTTELTSRVDTNGSGHSLAGQSSVQGLQLAAASVALASLMAGAADAKVILAQPELKKVCSMAYSRSCGLSRP